LLVHAHPDDETLTTGATMARYAARGDHVTLVTCTLGEQGEVIAPELAHLQADRTDALGPHRAAELSAAMRELGVSDHRLLAGGRWRDSGMAWVRPGIAGAGALESHPDALVRAPLGEAAAALAEVVREIRPQVVVTYDPQGGYGHPDHIKTHEITSAAIDLIAAESAASGSQEGEDPAPVPALYWIRVPHTWAERERAALLAGATPASMTPPAAGEPYPPAVVEDLDVTVVVDASAYLARKRAALQAHVTQVRVEGDVYALSNGEAHLLSGREAYQRAGASRAAGEPVLDDLFAGRGSSPS
jgi:N-acetyl-1-D-myo-inositol-2-amino-2-deoxy-alpha-D-glucopyranoside deacetylase